MTPGEERLPPGRLVAWYGDDFTGSAAVMEVLSFAGIPSVLFFDNPSPAQLAEFRDYRGIGVAGMARAKSPAWMDGHLPAVFRALAGMEAPLIHYKICSTFDSSPTVGSIGKAIEIAEAEIATDFIPLLVGAPQMDRFQAFGNLFASVAGIGYRLDRHPTMSRHPVTPMKEADVRLHLAAQTDRRIGLVDFVSMKKDRHRETLARELASRARIIALDVVDEETLVACGELIWEGRSRGRLAVGSQGVEYALVAWWRSCGLLSNAEPPPELKPADRIAVVSGSCSPDTASQIQCAIGKGFVAIPLDPLRAFDPCDWQAELDRVSEAALQALRDGRDPIVHTALGPDDPGVADFLAKSGSGDGGAAARLGMGLSSVLDRLIREGGIKRCAVAGGDTSGHVVGALGIYALTAAGFVTPGASINKAWSEDPAFSRLEIALKGGQMGTANYFMQIKQGGIFPAHREV